MLKVRFSRTAPVIREKRECYIGEIPLYLRSNITNEGKKEVLRNLLKSDIPEEMIAEQLDLDLYTARYKKCW